MGEKLAIVKQSVNMHISLYMYEIILIYSRDFNMTYNITSALSLQRLFFLHLTHAEREFWVCRFVQNHD